MSDELIARLRAAADDVSKATPALSALAHGIKLVDWSPDIREAADRIERMEAVVEAARNFVGSMTFYDGLDGFPIPGLAANWRATRDALAALDAQINNPTQADKVRDAQVVVGDGNKPTYHNLRSCPNAVSWCEGPDRYAGICNACLATWAEETRGTMPVAENPPV